MIGLADLLLRLLGSAVFVLSIIIGFSVLPKLYRAKGKGTIYRIVRESCIGFSIWGLIRTRVIPDFIGYPLSNIIVTFLVIFIGTVFALNLLRFLKLVRK